ncbi:MAG: T9SS type A sorting domain-containing protein [Ignavibacteria bacterium]|nr:T9SS type A sorting domain-containing protein [Ignavibacteria bacterium]
MLIVNLITPINNAIVVPLNTYLIWKKPVINATRYKLILSRDSLQNDIVLNDSAITDTLRYISGLEYETFYYWSVTAYDTLGNVKTSDVWKFLSTSFLINPPFASRIYNNSVNFVWHKMAGAVSYKLEVAEDYEFTRKVFVDSAITDTVRLVDPLPYSFSYYWKVSLKDINGYFRTSQVWIFSRDFPVPVELSGFVSEVNQNNVKLNWTTASETNNSGFDIERSDNGIWLKIGSVSGNGNSNVENNYSYTDKNLNTGIYNYRLKQLDFNGNFEYYDLENEVNIGIPLKYELSQNYPNPFNPSTKINFNLPADVHVSLKIFDMTGREIKTLVNEVKTAGYHSVLFSGNDISSGVYFYILKTNNFKAGRKMLLIK